MWDLSSQTRDEPIPPAVEAWSLNHWAGCQGSPCLFVFNNPGDIYLSKDDILIELEKIEFSHILYHILTFNLILAY